MKKNYFVLLLAAMVALACSKEPNGGNGGLTEKGDGSSVFFDIDLQLPQAGGTRSATNNDNEDTNKDGKTPSDEDPDYEYGHDYENQVRNLILVLTDASDNYIAHSVVDALPPTQKGDENYNVTGNATYKRSDIIKEYEAGGKLADNKTVHVYAFCNYTARLADAFENLSAANKAGDGENSTYTDEATAVSGSWINFIGNIVESNGSAATNSVWGKNAFLMTNAQIKTVTFPDDPEDWDNYTSESNPFHLSDNNTETDCNNTGAVKVERAAARFDYNDGATDPSIEGRSGDERTYKLTGKYDIFDENGGPEQSGAVVTQNVNLFKIVLTDMSLVNMSKNYFYLRRVSDNGTKNGWRIGKGETKTNYVVDTDFGVKGTSAGIDESAVGDLSNNFNYTLFSGESFRRGSETIFEYNTTGWYTSKIADVIRGENDTWEGSNNRYHIWRYLTENTIPKGTDDKAQIVGFTTGVVFKGQITAGDNIDALYATSTGTARFVSEDVKKAINGTWDRGDYPALYMKSNLFYAGFDDYVEAAFKAGEGSAEYINASDVLSNWKLYYDGEEIPETGKFTNAPTEEETSKEHNIPLTVEIYAQINELAEQSQDETNYTTDLDETSRDFKNLVTVKKFSIYEPEQYTEGGQTKYGYFCLYFYWNRHNDNGNGSVMGPMEFATVRNNVYKLTVTKIGKIGHPTIPDNDPDPVDPNDPDEPDNVYMDVRIEVLPWVVRVNNIEF